MPVAAPDADVENMIDDAYEKLIALKDVLVLANLDYTPFYFQVKDFLTYLEDLQQEDFE